MTKDDIGIVEKLTMQRPTHVGWNAEGGEVIRYHPVNPDGPEAAAIITEMVEALESLKALNQGVYDNDSLASGQRNFAKLCIDKIDTILAKVSGK